MKLEISKKEKNAKRYVQILILALLLTPTLTFAQTTWNDVIFTLMQILDGLVPIIIGLGILFFMWGIFKYVFSTGKVEQEKARAVIVGGLISIVVMVSVWALVRIIANTLDLRLGGGLNRENHSPSELYNNYLRR